MSWTSLKVSVDQVIVDRVMFLGNINYIENVIVSPLKSTFLKLYKILIKSLKELTEDFFLIICPG